VRRTFAIVEPAGATAKELREQLERRGELWREVRLLTARDAEVGTLTEVGGAAAVVGRLDGDALAGVDLAFFAGPAEGARAALALLPAAARAVVLSPDAAADDGPLLVAGVNLPATIDARVAVSPHPGAILLAHLLAPLREHGLRHAEATLLQPVSTFPGEALDQLFAQARDLLTFQSPGESPYWERQLAFNLLATPEPADGLAAQAESVLAESASGERVEVTAQVVQAGVFHGLAASVHLAFAAEPSPAALREALAAAPWVRWAEQEPLGPVDVAGSDEVLVGHLRRHPRRPTSWWAWAAMDNLTRGGASNALALAEAMA
jgi:aspartate-semialdehyde dehydrogenase